MFSIMDPKLNTLFQRQIQFENEEMIISEYYYDLKWMKKLFYLIIDEILDKDSDELFDDPLADYHKGSKMENHPNHDNYYYLQLCKILNLYKYDKILDSFKKFIKELLIYEIREKIEQIESGVAFFDYCLLAQRLYHQSNPIKEDILEMIAFSQEILYNMSEIADNEIEKKYDEIASECED